MEKSDDRRMVEAFHYVRDVYRNISWMLLSCDPLMEERGFLTDIKKWIAILPKCKLVLSPGNISDTWLPCFAFRQYYNRDYPLVDNRDYPLDLITIDAVVWDDTRPEFDTPLCIASRMLVNDEAPEALLRISVIQMWDNNTAKPDGVVRVLSEDSPNLPESKRKEMAQHVRGGRILSIAVPLLEVCNIDVLDNRLINPLLKQGRTELDLAPERAANQ
jgi:hypothetical protein